MKQGLISSTHPSHATRDSKEAVMRASQPEQTTCAAIEMKTELSTEENLPVDLTGWSTKKRRERYDGARLIMPSRLRVVGGGTDQPSYEFVWCGDEWVQGRHASGPFPKNWDRRRMEHQVKVQVRTYCDNVPLWLGYSRESRLWAGKRRNGKS